jgi:hypothetical protein
MSTEERRRATAALIRRAAAVISIHSGEKNSGFPAWESLPIT